VAISSDTTNPLLVLLAHNIGTADEIITGTFSFAKNMHVILPVNATDVLGGLEEEDFSTIPREALALCA